MTSCYVILGKAGDILSVAPIFYEQYRATKKQPLVVTSRDYAHIFDRMPFVQTAVLKSDWTELDEAMLWAKQRFNKVTCLATFGRDFPMRQLTTSFQLDQWQKAGVMSKWDTLPMAGLQRGESGSFNEPTILYADHSQSSPFLQKEDLHKLLVESFPKHSIIRLSMHKLPHLFDFLEWYDATDALVTVETSHLHLSAASKKPVIALASDKPSKWHGSCWSKRFDFYCRYSEYENRRDELVQALKDSIGKKLKPQVVELN